MTGCLPFHLQDPMSVYGDRQAIQVALVRPERLSKVKAGIRHFATAHARYAGGMHP